MLLYNIESMAKKMTIDYKEVTNHIEHMGLRGNSRESVLKKYIKQLLPKKYAVGSGIVTDVYGTQSKQQDFFVYDAFNSPVFLHMESFCVIPVESVYATVEVKSSITKETLVQSVENIKSVKQLSINVLKNSMFIPSNYNFIMGTIFSYSSDSAIETIAQNLNEICKDIPKECQPTVVCILDKGLILNVMKENMREISIIPSEKTMWAIIKNTDDINFYLFYLILQQHLNNAYNFPPNLLKYAEESHALDGISSMIPNTMIPDDMLMEIGETKYTGKELKFLGNSQELVFKYLTHQLTKEELDKSGKSLDEVIEMTENTLSLITRSFGDTSNK